MKKYILFVSAAIMVSAQNLNAQLNKAVSLYNDYEQYNNAASIPSAKEKIDIACQDEDSKTKAKTWFYKGKIYLALFDTQLKQELGKSKETDISKKLLEAYLTIPTEALDESRSAFEKGIELDEKKSYTSEANDKLKIIASNFSDIGYSFIIKDKFENAIANYQKSYDLKLKMNVIDTGIINNIAVAYREIKNNPKSEEYFQKLINLNYLVESNYLEILKLYYASNDTASVSRVLNKALTALPNNYTFLIEKINHYLKAGKSDAAINSIVQAIGQNPTNHELHLVLGQTYNQMAFPFDAAGNDLPRPAKYDELVKKADEELNKAIEIKPDYYAGLYTLGLFYNNVGADITKKAQKIKDPKKIKVEEDKADALFAKAIPLLEKAHGIDNSDMDVKRTLKQLYVRTGQAGSEKFKKLDEEMKNSAK